jgi:type I restriction enzyme S subunit
MKIKLRQAFDLQMGKTPARNRPDYWNGDHKWISIADIGNAGKFLTKTKESITAAGIDGSGIKVVPQGTVIMSFKLSIGKTAITSEDMYTNEAIMAFIDNGKFAVDTNYLYHLCCGTNWTAGTNKAVMGLTLNKATLLEKEIPLPDINEQHEIATKLDKIDALIAERQQQLELIDQAVKSRFIELFGDPQRNPHGYKHTKLSDIATYYNGLTYKPENVAAEGTIVLRSSNIQNSQLDFADTVRVDCAIKERLMVQKNDILMCSRNGSAKLVGKVALIKDIQEPMSFGAFMMIIRSHYFGYLMTYFQMDAFRQQIKTGATTTINQITGKMLDDVTIPLPPMSLVDQFATFVEQTDKSKLAVQKGLQELEILKKSLMQQYFG